MPECLLPADEEGDNESSTEFLRLLPYGLQMLSNLNSLLIYPGSLESDMPGNVEMEEPSWDIDRVSQLLSGLAIVFRSKRLKHLTDLRLHLPCTHNFEEMNASMSDDFTNRLMHLPGGHSK